MKECCLLKLQFSLLQVFATPILNVDINEDGIPADPGLTVETSRQLDRLGANLPR